MVNNTRTELHRLLQERIEHPTRQEEIDRQIHQTFDLECAVLILDLAGFSRISLRHGIIHFLAMVHRMTAIATPILQRHSGTLVKQEADNLFAIFPTVQPAVDAAVDILKAFVAVNTGLPDEHDLHAGIGIGYGTMIMVAQEDLYGCEMNLACKLGEDLARRGEILLTDAAFQQLQGEPKDWERLILSISLMEIAAYKLRNISL